MPDHSLPESSPLAEDNAADGVTLGISPKAFIAAVAPLVLGVVLSAFFAGLDYLTANPGLFAALPQWAQIMVLAGLSALAAGTAAYRARPGVVVPPRG